MMQLICYLFPSVLAVWVSEKINKKEYTWKQWFYTYVLYVLSINFIIVTILSTLFHGADVYLSFTHFTNSLNMKYLLISLPLAIFLPFVYSMITKTFALDVTIDSIDMRKTKDDKKKKQKKSKK
ncbi:MAG TPA: hypothetical protein IAB58_01725 [Candidatus Pelethosoma merdigallinarum]|nr:hypothetical protein [Candidatus Pelethosoma merdigallinarum]